MLRILLLSVLMVGTFSVADSSYRTTEIEHSTYHNENDVLKLKLEIYQLKEKNIELQKIIDNFKLTKEQREEYRHQEAILNLKRQLRNSRANPQISLAF
ncbi:MAG: hypothetical protein DSZ11_00150 [Sulfurovum sp.]|nr:MAG: hypothetical protein DSZ11_00150 [Sulfurovum sp.]